MTAVSSPGRGFIMCRRVEPRTQNTKRHATRPKNEAGGATPGQNTTLTSFLSPVRHKPIPSDSHPSGVWLEPDSQIGRRCSWHQNTTMPHTTRTFESSSEIEPYLKTGSIEEESRTPEEESHGGPVKMTANHGTGAGLSANTIRLEPEKAFNRVVVWFQFGTKNNNNKTQTAVSGSTGGTTEASR